MKKFFQLIMVFLVMVMCNGCALMFSKREQICTLTSFPTDAVVTDVATGKNLGNTPLRLRLKRGNDYNFEVALPGYEVGVVTTDKSFNVVSIFNLCNYGIGFLIDWPTGAIYKIDPIPTVFLKKIENGDGVGPRTKKSNPKKPVEVPVPVDVEDVSVEA